MMEALFDLPAHLRKRLIASLESGVLGSPYSAAALSAVVGRHEGGESVGEALQALEAHGIAGQAAAAWVRTLDTLEGRVSKPDLVWSGPEVPGLHARNTRRVYEELICGAEHSVLASTYAFFDGPRAFELLANRMEERPKLRATLLLNIQRKRGDTSAADHVVRRFADRFWVHDWPGVTRPKVFYDPRSLEIDGPAGVLHAKAVVVDDKAAFITSANLTEAALDRNIEVGLLVRERATALSLAAHFHALIDRGLLSPLPAA